MFSDDKELVSIRGRIRVPLRPVNFRISQIIEHITMKPDVELLFVKVVVIWRGFFTLVNVVLQNIKSSLVRQRLDFPVDYHHQS